jgi:class 3 adenylate cyclase
MIWSAIGNTTNLAARLQQRTRELDASIVIDGATRSGARDDKGRLGGTAQNVDPGTQRAGRSLRAAACGRRSGQA